MAYINLSDCKFITHVPDMSGVPSLRELILDGCKSLTMMHDSVGFLKDLVVLSATDCTKLSSFLPSIWLPSLETLNLHGCKQVEHFPDIVGEMKKPLHLTLRFSAIRELPQSIVNLTGLSSVLMEYCNSFRDIPCNFFMLPKVMTLHLEGSEQVRESFRRFQSSGLVTTSCSNLRELYFRRGGLLDEDLHAILKCFPKLETLYVPENDFICLPVCIKKSVNLITLDVSECLKLQEIPELPSNIETVYARHCPLISKTTSFLWSQVWSTPLCLLFTYIIYWCLDS